MAFITKILIPKHNANILVPNVYKFSCLCANFRSRTALSCFGNYTKNSRNYQTSGKTHYDVMEISPNATQGQVKAAYYKLSLAYHPDHGRGDTERFRVLTEAYETLKDVRKRSFYDKGLAAHHATETNSEEQTASPAKESATAMNTSNMQELDKWTKEHISEFVKTQAELREHRTTMRQIKKETREESVDMQLVIIFGLVFWAIYSVFEWGRNAQPTRPDPTIDTCKTRPDGPG